MWFRSRHLGLETYQCLISAWSRSRPSGGGARVSGARWDRSFWRPLSFLPFLPLPLEVGPLEVSPLNPVRESGERCKLIQPPTILMHFEKHLKCALFYAHDLSFYAYPCLNRAHRMFVYFMSPKITAPFSATPLLAPGGICPRPAANAYRPFTYRAQDEYWKYVLSRKLSIFVYVELDDAIMKHVKR